MVTEDQIREQELTTDDVLDREVVEPQQEVELLPEWDDDAEAPGENVHIDGDELVWERDGFESRLRSHETTHWKVDLTIPRDYGQYQPRPVDLKCSPIPEHGFVESVETDNYAAVGATLVLVSNYQPTYEVNKFIDHLIDDAEAAEEFTDDLESKLSVARENE